MKKTARRQILTGGSACLLAVLTALALPLHAQERLPQRNLLIEWRVTGRTQGEQRVNGVQTGQYIIDSRGRVIGRTAIALGTLSTDDRSSDAQQVQVLNGARARLYVGRSQPYTTWQWAWNGGGAPAAGTPGTPGGSGASATPGSVGVQVMPQTVWIDIGDGLSVRPRWHGGHAPVLLDLEAQARQPGQLGGAYTDPDGQTRRLEVSSTLSVPMGNWVVVARTGVQGSQQQAGSYSTRDVDSTDAQQLEIRVTAP